MAGAVNPGAQSCPCLLPSPRRAAQRGVPAPSPPHTAQDCGWVKKRVANLDVLYEPTCVLLCLVCLEKALAKKGLMPDFDCSPESQVLVKSPGEPSPAPAPGSPPQWCGTDGRTDRRRHPWNCAPWAGPLASRGAGIVPCPGQGLWAASSPFQRLQCCASKAQNPHFGASRVTRTLSP